MYTCLMNETLTNHELTLLEVNQEDYKNNPVLYANQYTEEWVSYLLAIDASDYDQINQLKQLVSKLGQKQQQSFWQSNTGLSRLLENQIHDLSGKEKSTKLIQQLHKHVLKIKPPKHTLWMRLFNQFKLLFSIKETVWEMWLESYPSQKSQILTITSKLEKIKKTLKNEMSLLVPEHIKMDQHLVLLENYCDILSELDTRMAQELQLNQSMSKASQELIQSEILPQLHNRIIELQQQLLIARQTLMTLDLFIHQAESHIKNIDQTNQTMLAAVEITASLFVLKQSDYSKTTKDKPHINNRMLNQKLIQARQKIEMALNQLDETQKSSSNSLTSES
ncbi:MAG: hypothetical protein AB8B80_02270 [Marinicellaceae bacterium]